MSALYRAISPLAHAWTRFFIWAYPLGLGLLLGHAYLLLETKGRRTGLTRVTPLGYVGWATDFLVQPLHGTDSDWLRNLQASSEVNVLVGRRSLNCLGRVIDGQRERQLALRVVATSRSVSGWTARRHFSLASHIDELSLYVASQDMGKQIVLLELESPE